MHMLRFGLGTLAIVGVVGGALADDSGHASINSLKWEMLQMRRTEHHSRLFASSFSPYGSRWRACAVEQIGVMNGCGYHHHPHQ
jgi:hypothetical protein